MATVAINRMTKADKAGAAMDYFKYFSSFDFKESNFSVSAKDFTTVPVAVAEYLASKKVSMVQYLIKDRETPEYIAHKLYGNEKLAWIILLCNNIVDWFSEFPLTDRELLTVLMNRYQVPVYDRIGSSYILNPVRTKAVTEKKLFFEGRMDSEYVAYEYYAEDGSAIELRPHHFELNGEIVPWNYSDVLGRIAQPISLYVHEQRENDKRRLLAVPSESHIAKISTELQSLMRAPSYDDKL